MPTNRYRNDNMTMSFPPFTGAVRAIILFSTGVYLLILLSRAFAPEIGNLLAANGALVAQDVLHGKVWQLVTYGFVNFDPMNFALSMVGVYFLGGTVEGALGSRRFVLFYVSSLIVAAVFGTLFAVSGVVGQGAAYGAGAATNAILMGFYLLNRNGSLMLFPFPIQIPAKYIVIGIAALETAYLLLAHFALFYLVDLFGLVAGYGCFAYFLAQHSASRPSAAGLGRGLSDRMYAVAPAKREPLMARMKNAYHRWKRRRMAKKFEVYMRKHDRSVYFDEHGNYRGHEMPEDEKKEDGDGKGGWVN